MIHRSQGATTVQLEQGGAVTALNKRIAALTRRMLHFTVAAAVAAVSALRLTGYGLAADSSGDILREEQRQSCLATITAQATVADVRLAGRDLDTDLEEYLTEVTSTALDEIGRC